MAEVTAAMVKTLRDRTGAGMMDCKAALAETKGDVEGAIDWLRKKGLAKAAKKAGRVAAEGLVAVAVAGKAGAVIEVNAETDFVARNEEFQALARNVANVALSKNGDYEQTAAAKIPGTDQSVRDTVTGLVAKIGENMNFRRSAGLTVTDGVVVSYVHGQIAPGLGKIGVIVALSSKGDAEKLAAFGRQLAMHVAAANPLAVSEDKLDPAVVARERDILADQARQSGKPEAVVQKMIEGRLRKFYEDSVLLSQAFVIDPESTVKKALAAAEADAGAPIAVTGFVRFALGEGIDKEASDFAAEVAKAAAS